MGLTENSANQASNPEMQGNSPHPAPTAVAVDPKAVTPRGADPILDTQRLGENPAPKGEGKPPPDSDNGASKDARDMGNNGNPAQSAERPSAEERNRSPAPLNEDHPVTREL
ncbi:MAG: hypothetical protein K0Q91_742 [Fibrobacteria bacterium]|jgi:hypothetical protein|nr:hypothetical protein [Fibrobacteria bacterium]